MVLGLRDSSEKNYAPDSGAAQNNAKIEIKNLWQINVAIAKMPFSWPDTYLSGEEAKACVEITNEYGTTFTPSTVSGAGMNLNITFDPDLTTPGTYTLTIKEGIASLEGVKSSAKTFTNLFVIPGTTPEPVDPGTDPDPVDPDPGTDPDPVDPDPGTETEWYTDFTVTIEDGSTARFAFPNLGSAKLVQETSDGLDKHITATENGHTYFPYMAMTTSLNTEVIAYFNEGELSENSVIRMDADVISADGEPNPELVWPKGSEIPEPGPEPSTPTVNEKLSWDLSAVGTLNSDGTYTNTYSSDDDIHSVSDISRVQIKIAKPASMDATEWQVIALGFYVNDEAAANVKVTNGTETYVPSSVASNGNYIGINLMFSDPIDADGSYTISIPEGLVTFGDGTVSAAAELSNCFTVKSDAVKLSFNPYNVDPASNSELTASQLSKVTITFPNAVDTYDDDQTIELNTEFYSTLSQAASHITLTLIDESLDEDEDPFSIAATSLEILDSFSIQVSFAGKNIPEGKYEFGIPGMMFRNSANHSVLNTGLITYYNVVDAPTYNLTEYTFTPEPKVTVAELSTIAITFKQPVKIVNDNVAEGDYSVVSLISATAEYPCTNIAYDENDDATCVFTFDKITENGTYTLTIPAGFFAIDVPGVPEGASEQIKAEFVVGNIDSVASLLGDADSYTVVDLAGRVVLRDAEKSALAGLEEGLYVINGKKVIIRK